MKMLLSFRRDGGALIFFGFDKTVKYHATGRAVVMDVSDYMYGVAL